MRDPAVGFQARDWLISLPQPPPCWFDFKGGEDGLKGSRAARQSLSCSVGSPSAFTFKGEANCQPGLPLQLPF